MHKPEIMAFASKCFLYLIPVLLLLPVSVVAQNITLGSALTAAVDKNSSWKSPSGDFAFGFQQIEPGVFLLAVWFEKIPEKTVIWSAGGENKIQVLQVGARIELTSDSKFILSDSGGNQTWEAPLSGSGTVAYAAMLDTGNFVLASQGGNNNLWETFNEPTDTILPTQIMKLDTNLVARYLERNFSYGRFQFSMQSDGDLVLYTRRFPTNAVNKAYWEAGTAGSGYQVVFNQTGDIYLEARNGSKLNNVTSSGVSSRDYYQRGILEYDGVFRQYIYPKNTSVSAGWPMAWSWQSAPVPENICTSIVQDLGDGACGYNSYCFMGNDKRPKCECPPGYKFLDPNNEMNGCSQDFAPQECDGGQDAGLMFTFREMADTNWPSKDYERFDSFDEDWCRQSCLRDCFCAVAIYNNLKQCFKKNIPFLNGFQDSNISGTKSLIKIRIANSTSTAAGGNSNQKNNSRLNVILTALLSSSAFLNLVLLIAFLWAVFSLRYKPRRMVQDLVAIKGTGLQSFTYKELEEASDKFKEEIGKGACSTVYKAILGSGNIKTVVAVKRLDKMVTDSEQEFQAEMSAIGKTNHKNLVQLLGFCNEGQHRLLVYEYMSNGSLASYLFGDSRPSWYKRTLIAFGTARGLVYLHEECSNQIIHCDIKPQNILLDDSCKARISDFGLAKLLKSDQTRTLTAIRGTKGYVAPEWFRNMAVTAKVDVYSFGILLLELICGRKAFDQDAENEFQMILADWAYDCYEERTVHQLVHDDEEAMQDIKRVEIFVMIAIWCIQDDPSLRPTMRRVSQMLEGAVEVPHPPKSPHSSIYFLPPKTE